MLHASSKRSNAGFSLIELVIAMTLTLAVMSIATVLLAQALNTRTRTNSNNDALADAQRALNIMSREIASAGFNLSGNGIVAGDTSTDSNGNSTLRIRSNINKFDTTASITARNGISVVGEDIGEDVKYFIHKASNTNLLARHDEYGAAGGAVTVLANRLDSLYMHYYAQKVTYTTSGCNVSGASAAEVAPASAGYVVIAVCVQLDAVGKPESPGYQPSKNVLLVSDITLRNANLTDY